MGNGLGCIRGLSPGRRSRPVGAAQPHSAMDSRLVGSRSFPKRSTPGTPTCTAPEREAACANSRSNQLAAHPPNALVAASPRAPNPRVPICSSSTSPVRAAGEGRRGCPAASHPSRPPPGPRGPPPPPTPAPPMPAGSAGPALTRVRATTSRRASTRTAGRRSPRRSPPAAWIHRRPAQRPACPETDRGDSRRRGVRVPAPAGDGRPVDARFTGPSPFPPGRRAARGPRFGEPLWRGGWA